MSEETAASGRRPVRRSRVRGAPAIVANSSVKAERPLRDVIEARSFVEAERPSDDEKDAGAMDPKAMNAEAARMPDRPGWL